MEEAIWSSRIARQVAEALGYAPLGTSPGTDQVVFDAEAEQITKDLTETFRYLPLEQINWVSDFAEFLRAHRTAGKPRIHLEAGVPDTFREVLDFARFLRGRYGADQPADEKDYWTEEDEQDLTRDTWLRLEAEDPWPEDDSYPIQEQGNAETG